MDVVGEAEAITAAAASNGSPTPERHVRADLYLPGLGLIHEEARSLCVRADKAGDGRAHHRLLLLLSLVDEIEGELEGRK